MCKFFKNRTVKKTLLMTMSLLLMSAMLPDNGASAREQDRFGTYAKASHWGRSDLRAYLNNGLANVTEDGTVSGKNYGMDSTDGAYASDNTSGYAKYFSDAEYEVLQPFTYDTAVDETSKYSVTDKLWLPSANYSDGMNQIISWGKEDISSDDQYRKTIKEDKQRIIPISYWSESSASGAFLRSSCYESDDMVLTAVRGKSTGKSKVNKSDVGTAVALKIDLTSVRFASVVTAVGELGGEGGAKKIEISGSNNLGSKTAGGTKDYGMYLKTFSDCLFSPTALSFDGHNLTVNYSGGVAGQYIVVHVFKEDDVALGTTNYVATKKIVESDTSATIDVRNWYLYSFDGYTVKVWMEDGSGSLAKATAPITLSDYENENHRVFAMKEDLQTSWGDLSKLSEDDYDNVLAGKNTSSNNHIMGAYATNQKIYFGSPDNNVGAVSSFWIAGRETAANGGEIAADGSIMTLYQTKPIYDQFNPFNLSKDNYKENITVSLQDNQSGIYTGNAMTYSGTVTFQDGEGNVFSCPGNDITYQYSTDDGLTWNNGMPTDVGVYKIRAIAAAYDIYESAVSDPVTFTVKGVPSARDFVFAAPENLTYDGTAKEAVITSGNAGMGEITVKYYKADGLTPAVGTDVSAAPAQAGEYIVKIDAAGGSLYIAASDVSAGSWSFTIEKAEPVYAAPVLKEKEVDYGTKLGNVYSVAQLKNLLGVPKFNDGTEIPGTWSWADGTEASTGAAGTNTFKAIFTPDAGIINQFAWNLLPGWDETAGVISVDVPVKVKALPTDDDGVDDGDSKLPPKTGDESPYFKVLGIGFVMLLTSGLVLTAKKRKRA